MSRVIAVANQKGGVGKTTTAVALTAALADRGQRVALVDVDPQASAGAALGFDVTGTYTSLYDCMAGARSRYAIPLHAACVSLAGGEHLYPSDIRLAELEAQLTQAVKREYILRDLLAPLRAQYDAILLDCPPSLGWLTLNALTAADSVLIPVVPDYLSARGLAGLYNTVDLVQRHLNPDLTFAGVVLTRVQAQTVEHQTRRQDIIDLCRAIDIPVLSTEIPNTIRAASAAGEGVPISRHSSGNGARAAYLALAAILFPVEVSHAR